MKLIKVFDDDELNPKSGRAYLENGHLILKDDFMGLSAGCRLLVNSNYVIKFKDTCELNSLLKAETRQNKLFN